MSDGRERRSRRAALVALALFLVVPAAAEEEPTAGELAELRGLIEEMRQAHAAEVESLTQRIDELEGEQSRRDDPAPRVRAVETEPVIYDREGPVMERLERLERHLDLEESDITRGFTFSGYFRSGYGIDQESEKLEAFQAPNADSKYRLGNEEETYVETTFIYDFPMLQLGEGKEFYVQFRPSYLVPDADFNESSFSLREAWAGARGVWDANPTAAFWAGQRFYDRFDVHMTDFYYLDMSGFGGGVEDLQVGDWGKFAIAWFGGTLDSFVRPHAKTTTCRPWKKYRIR